MEEEQCPCDDCDATCDYWDSKYCCTYCQTFRVFKIIPKVEGDEK